MMAYYASVETSARSVFGADADLAVEVFTLVSLY